MEHFANYTEGITIDGAAILKDGHTMFPQDIISDLNRKSFLEKRKIDLEKAITEALEENKTLAYYAKYIDKRLGKGWIQNIYEALS